jgi:predicted lipoprotein with Yx(FWY)xxD motif
MRILKQLTLAAVLAGAATAAMAEAYGSSPVLTGRIGDEVYLMDAQKMTLYTFDKDTAGVSNCYDACAANWPPVLAEAGTTLANGYSQIARKDGTMQIAYKGQPLYLWVNDTAPGEMTGDGVKDVWHVARP